MLLTKNILVAKWTYYNMPSLTNIIRAWYFYLERPRVLVYIPVLLFTVELVVKIYLKNIHFK